MSLTMRYAARSDRGLIREANEDSVYAGPRLLAVADGMGGMAAGEVASNIVIGALAPLDEDFSNTDAVDALRNHIEQANLDLRGAVQENPALEGMGTTLTAMLFTGTRLVLLHVGDSRAYVWRDGELAQITRDDTYVQMLVDEGRITAEEATTHPQRSLLTRALDGRDVDPDVSVREARVGDRYLLCSDGLSGVVTPATMAEALEIPDAGAAADRLIQLALRGGGPDNITVVVADVVESDLEEDAPVVGGAAAADRGRTSAASADSAAGRAALAAPPPEPRNEPEPDGEPTVELDPKVKGRRRFRRVVVALVVLAVLVGGAAWGWYYTQQQYYVGVTDKGNVAIYRGVQGKIGSVRFSTEVEESDLRLSDLDALARDDVKEGIWAKNRDEARDHIAKLRRRVLPSCESLSPEQSPSPNVSATPSPSATPGTSPSPSPKSEKAKPGENCRDSGAGAAQ